MKCELCHNRDAETAIPVVKDGREDELYVCKECAKGERLKRQKKSQRTRKTGGLPPGVSMSVTRIGGDGEPPPQIIEAIMNAMNGVVSELEAAEASAKKRRAENREYRALDMRKVTPAYKAGGGIHLEGLYLIGEIDSVQRAVKALGLKLEGRQLDGIADAGHVYSLMYQEGDAERASRVLDALLRQENFARVRVYSEMPRVLNDAVCRALAILKNCQLLSPGELFDLLSPLRIASLFQMLEGVTLTQIEKMMASIKPDAASEKMTPQERDNADGARADDINARFADVVYDDRSAEDRRL